MKALHPSDPMTEVRGIPDHSALPSLCMNFQSTFTISPEPNAVGTWQFDASLIPHPIAFMAFSRTTNLGTVNGNLLNSQIDGLTHADKFAAFKKLAQRWRLAYMGATVYQDGPDLANQGTIVVAQPPVQPRRRFISATLTIPTIVEQGAAQAIEYTAEDKPDFTRSQAMPNAYFNRSREGAYVPLKLTETCQDWVSEADEVSHTEFFPSPTGTAVLNVPTVGITPMFPYFDLAPLWLQTSGAGLTGDATSPTLSGNWAHISARNLSVQTSYSIFVRAGIEMQVSPSSSLSPQLKLSPMYDRQALDTYFAVCRELKDAYPADYNTTGKLWRVISEAVKKIAPSLQLIPGGRVLAPMLMAGVTAGDQIADLRQSKRRKRKNRIQSKVLRGVGPPVRRETKPRPQESYPKITRVVGAPFTPRK